MYLIINNQIQKWLSLVFKWQILNVFHPNVCLFVFWLCCLCCLLLINGLVVGNFRANCGSSQPAWVVELWQLRAAWERRDEAQYPVISSRARWLSQPQITRGRWRASEWKERWKKRREKQHSLHKDICVKLPWKAYLAKDVVAEIIWVPCAKF